MSRYAGIVGFAAGVAAGAGLMLLLSSPSEPEQLDAAGSTGPAVPGRPESGAPLLPGPEASEGELAVALERARSAEAQLLAANEELRRLRATPRTFVVDPKRPGFDARVEYTLKRYFDQLGGLDPAVIDALREIERRHVEELEAQFKLAGTLRERIERARSEGRDTRVLQTEAQELQARVRRMLREKHTEVLEALPHQIHTRFREVFEKE